MQYLYIFILVKEYDDPNYSNALVVTPPEIHRAYQKLTGEIADILATKNFKKLRRACFQEICSPTSTLPESLLQDIKPTNNLDDMLDTLALSPYWNWVDTRLLQALVSASRSAEAALKLEKFKKNHYVHKVSEVLPSVIVRPTTDKIIFTEKFNKDPKELTLLDLMKHKQKLEYVMDIGKNKIILSGIRTGCVELTWQVPSDLAHQAYTSMKKNQDMLSSLAIESLVCKEADRFAGLPLLWRGQEVREIGPIEPLPKHVRQEPYSLPQGFHWVTLSSSDVEEVVKFINKYVNTRIIDSYCINFIIKHPNTRDKWQFGIRATNGKLVAVVIAFPVCVNIGGVSVTCMEQVLGHHPKYNGKRMFYVIIKELMRRANLHDINYHLIFTKYYGVMKPITTLHTWQYNFDNPTSSQLPSSPRTPGWRRMTSEDVPSALAFINKWSSQFEIGQVFDNEEELAYNLLCLILPNYVYTYIVENEIDNITDLVSFKSINKMHMVFSIQIVAFTQTPIKQLLIDAFVCAKDLGVKVLIINNLNIKPDILPLSFHCQSPYNFSIYNYRYHETEETSVWIMM